MASLSERILLLTNPAPKVLDPEDDDNIDAAKVNKYNDDNGEALYAGSESRNPVAVSLDNYPEYAGKKVSRKSLKNFFHDDEKIFPKYDKESNDISKEMDEDLDSDENEHQDDEEEEELSEEDLEIFKSSVKKQSLPSDEESEEEEEDSAESEASDVESTKFLLTYENELYFCSDEESEEEEEDSAESEASDVENDDLTDKFSNIDVISEMEKGAAVKAQQELWHRLCESRIKIQKLLTLSNRLPQFDCWNILKKNVEKDVLQCINKGSNSLKFLLNNCLDLQAVVLSKNPEISIDESNINQETGKQSDEEIQSDTEEETEDQKVKSQGTVKKILKRKLKCDEYGDIVTKRHKSLLPYRTSTIARWDEKTKLSFGKITQKSFSTFESSAVKQIEQILQDETRLIKRAQLKRSLYRILGKPDDSEMKSKENTEKNECKSKQDMLLRDYDTEVFDDDDFYRQVLKDVIESKSVGIDPAVLRKQMEIQSVRNKIKKKVDTKASKGRKIRYDVHPKLIGFMKKMETSTVSDYDRDALIKRMFGKGYFGS